MNISHPDHFVTWFRQVAPYIHAFRGKTFVIGLGGDIVDTDHLNDFVHDVSLLHAMGIRIVLVHGARPQVEEELRLHGLQSHSHQGIRITDAPTLEAVKGALGEVRLEIEAAFSQGLPNTPMAHAQIQVIGGNFITARPMGIIDGIDYKLTGLVRKVASDAIRKVLDINAIVLMSSLGFSPTGEAFNLSWENVACETAIALKADKLIFMTETALPVDANGEHLSELLTDDAKILLQQNYFDESFTYFMQHAIKATERGVARAHLVPILQSGSVLVELFTHDGIGLMLADDDLEMIREATSDDIGGILQLMEPLEDEGVLVKRGREIIERDIGKFSVLLHDGVIFGCAAMYAYPDAKMAEMACLIVHPSAQGTGDGERILRRIEQRAKLIGLEKLFVLTTRAQHWFIKRGFNPAPVDELPNERQAFYNWQRMSQVLVKRLG
jgi:amino-acid N-acetyltransferase